MASRWLIRSLALLLLTLSFAAWVGSYLRHTWIDFYFWRYEFNAELDSGQISAGAAYGEKQDSSLNLYCSLDSPNPTVSRNFYSKADRHFAGFGYCHFKYPASPLERWIIIAPLWFPAIVSVTLLRFAWRKPKAKPKGFPIQSTATTP